MRENKDIVLFDGICNLCNTWGKFIVKHDLDNRFRLLSIQSNEGQEILRHFGYPDDYLESIILITGGQSYEKSEAVLAIMAKMKYPWKLFTIFKVAPLVFRDWLYGLIAKNRYKIFGKNEFCPIIPNDDRKKS
ncbi:MAG: DUF393 domain-containing protein [Sulfurovum sp.]|nr:DUF393 domain-containing protein [Sulfurovum sp.]